MRSLLLFFCLFVLYTIVQRDGQEAQRTAARDGRQHRQARRDVEAGRRAPLRHQHVFGHQKAFLECRFILFQPIVS